MIVLPLTEKLMNVGLKKDDDDNIYDIYDDGNADYNNDKYKGIDIIYGCDNNANGNDHDKISDNNRTNNDDNDDSIIITSVDTNDNRKKQHIGYR